MGNPVLASTAPLIASPRHVRINYGRLEELAAEIAARDFSKPQISTSPNFPQDVSTQEFATYLLVASALMFQFTDPVTKEKFSVDVDGREERGTNAVYACLTRSKSRIVDPYALRELADEQVAEIFSGKTPLPMLRERAAIMREIGKVLCDKYGGETRLLVEESGGMLFNEGSGFVERLTTDFPLSYDDSFSHMGISGRFDKKAQLAGSMLHRAIGTGPYNFKDTGELTVFADYVLPEVLRRKGVLEYSPYLANRVDNLLPLAAGRGPELEIRASTIHACEKLRTRANELRAPEGKEPLDSMQLDSALWAAGRSAERGAQHITPRTTDY